MEQSPLIDVAGSQVLFVSFSGFRIPFRARANSKTTVQDGDDVGNGCQYNEEYDDDNCDNVVSANHCGTKFVVCYSRGLLLLRLECVSKDSSMADRGWSQTGNEHRFVWQIYIYFRYIGLYFACCTSKGS